MILVWKSAVKKLLDTIYRENIQEKDLSPERIKCLIYNIYNTILKTVWELNVDIEENLQVNEFLLQEDIRKIFSKFNEKVGSICEIIKCEKENKNKKLINKVILYIDNNLTDYNLNLSTIEQKFNRSGKYLSKVFKEETNCNFVDYINSKKVELAKEYLASLSISDTCEKVGLASMSTFMRVFKKYTGLSPGQYQEMYRRKV